MNTASSWTLRQALPALILALGIAGFLVVMELTHHPATRSEAPAIPLHAADDESRTLTLVWMGPPYHPTATNGTWVQRLFEERFNVAFKPVFLGFGQSDEVKALMYAGGGVPDISWEGDPSSVQQFAAHGFLCELPYELLLKHAPNYVKLVNRLAPTAWLLSYWNGANYGIPNLWLDGQHPGPGLWRKDWLQKVGITHAPETIEEMHAAFRKFVEEDPDANGKRDTYAFSSPMVYWAAFNEIYGAYGVAPYNWMEKDGKAVWGGTLPETKEALATLRQWYAEGLLHPDFVTDDHTMHSQKFMNGKIGYLSGGAADLEPEKPTSLTSKTRALCNAPNAELLSGVFPRGPGGKRGSWCWGGVGNIWVLGRQVADHPEKAIRILKMLEAVTTNETFFVESKIGRRGLHWDYVDPAAGKEGGIRYLPPYDQPQIARREVLPGTPDLAGGTFFNLANCGDPAFYNQYRSRKYVDYLYTCQNPTFGIRDILGKADVMPSAGRYLKGLRSYQEAFFAQIIRGTRGLETFDDFVTGWYDRGGTLLTREANDLMKARNRIFAQMGVEGSTPPP